MKGCSIHRSLVGLVLVLVLCAGGYYRWSQLPVTVAIVIEPGQRAMACGMKRAELKKIPHTRVDGNHEITLPLNAWSLDVLLLQPSIWGRTMGTTYSIRINEILPSSLVDKQLRDINLELKNVNRQMSTWDRESEISKFNHSTSTNAMAVSVDFAKVVTRALEFGQSTQGAFDPTLQPLLNLWGFGSEGIANSVPSREALVRAKALTGWRKVSVPSPTSLRKSEPKVSLALGAIAKGYGVDAVARILDNAGFKNWFVEIGGEVIVKGLNAEGLPWKIGIQYPSINPLDERLQGILHLSKGAVATSGDYRNYMAVNGAIYSHILDPRTGNAALSDTASVTVYAPNCTDADALATALFVMGADEGIEWIEKRPDTEAMFLLRTGNGAIIERFSSGFAEATGYIPAGRLERGEN